MIKYLFCILLLLFTFRSLCATNDTKTCRIVMKDGGVLYGCLVIPTSAQSLKKKTLVIVVPSPLRTGEDYEFLSDSLTAKGIALFISSNPQPIGFRGNLLVKRQKFFYCTYSLGITETS